MCNDSAVISAFAYIWLCYFVCVYMSVCVCAYKSRGTLGIFRKALNEPSCDARYIINCTRTLVLKAQIL